MTVVLSCLVEFGVEHEYEGTYHFVAAYTTGSSASSAGYLYGLRRRSQQPLAGSLFQIMCADTQLLGLNVNRGAKDIDGIAMLAFENDYAEELVQLLKRLIQRSPTRTLYLVAEENGSASKVPGAPLSIEPTSIDGFSQIIRRGMKLDAVFKLVG